MFATSCFTKSSHQKIYIEFKLIKMENSCNSHSINSKSTAKPEMTTLKDTLFPVSISFLNYASIETSEAFEQSKLYIAFPYAWKQSSIHESHSNSEQHSLDFSLTYTWTANHSISSKSQTWPESGTISETKNKSKFLTSQSSSPTKSSSSKTSSSLSSASKSQRFPLKISSSTRFYMKFSIFLIS